MPKTSTVKLEKETMNKLKEEFPKMSYDSIINIKRQELEELKQAIPMVGQTEKQLLRINAELLLEIVKQNQQVLKHLEAKSNV